MVIRYVDNNDGVFLVREDPILDLINDIRKAIEDNTIAERTQTGGDAADVQVRT